MREIKTEIQIAAPPAKVWSILTDFENWKNWNPIINEASGEPALNSELTISMCGKDGKGGPRYKPVVSIFEKPNSFRWRAKMMASFLFTNDKIVELKEVNGGTHLIHIETFSGLMVPMFWSKMEQGMPMMLKSMNEALKKRAEEK